MTRWTLLLLATLAAAPALAGDGFDTAINYLDGRDWPDEHTPPYAEDVQGIAHDDAHWYITKQGGHGVVLYKIHVSQDLANPAITATTTPFASGLVFDGFDKFKGMDSFLNPSDGQWYLVIGVEGASGAGLAFYTPGLTYLGTAPISQGAAGWVAVHPGGDAYSGENETTHLNRFSLNWATIAGGGAPVATAAGTVQLVDESYAPLTMSQYQGGAFHPDGDKLYITSGFPGVPNGPHGIHVFDATGGSPWNRVIKSAQSGMFRYQFEPGGTVSEEPEDLTFWDLNGGQAPNIRGELHVLMLDNDWPDGDDVYLKHYTEAVWVDDDPNLTMNGDPATPHITVGNGYNMIQDSLELWVLPGSYPETLTLDKRVKIANPDPGGDAVIGQ